jgi:catechol 2,3-dioxygenase-like lactoylglutathione lyase family enzyme
MMDERPVLDQVNLVVKDMSASVDFYRSLGLAIPDRDPAWDDDHRSAAVPGGIDFDLDTDSFAAKWDAGWPGSKGRGGVVLGFRVSSRDAVDKLYGEVTGAGFTGQQEPYDAFWGARYAIVEDPDGNAVGLMSPIDPDRKSAPPSM